MPAGWIESDLCSAKVVRTDGKFELRDYPAMAVVETPTIRSAKGGDGSFMRLFRFISGGNAAKEKISMTTPVFMSGNDTNATMAFVLPAKLKTGEVPKPTDGAVTVHAATQSLKSSRAPVRATLSKEVDHPHAEIAKSTFRRGG